MGITFSVIGASILGSCGFKDGVNGFKRIGNNWSVSEYFRTTRWRNLLNYLVFKEI